MDLWSGRGGEWGTTEAKMAAIHADELRELFDMMDKDKSGEISFAEFKAAMHAFGQVMDPEVLKELIQKADTAGDGSIDFNEFSGIMSHGSANKITRSELLKFFQAFDLDCSGYITTAEFRHLLGTLGHDLNDDQMDELSKSIDVDGSGQCDVEEFGELLKGLGFEIVDDEDDDDGGAFDVAIPPPKNVPSAVSSGPLPIISTEFADIIKPVITKEGFVNEAELRRAMELLSIEKSLGTTDADANKSLHWDPNREKRGIGEVLYKANHIALIVSDVGRSAAFYSDIIGLQQIRRPDFDRHGAWFTMGNLELHLIKGIPVVHSGDDLIVGHISLETHNIDRVPAILEAKGVSYRQNVSVPKGVMAKGSGTNDSSDSGAIVKQYFLRDPDGYYLEICNCDVLTQYCLGKKDSLAGYNEGVKPLNIQDASVLSLIGLRLSKNARVHALRLKQIMDSELKGCPDYEKIGKALGHTPAKQVDVGKLKNLMVRRSVYGDICQNEDETGLTKALLAAGNSVPGAVDIMTIKAGDEHIFKPPAFFENGAKVDTKTFAVNKKRES